MNVHRLSIRRPHPNGVVRQAVDPPKYGPPGAALAGKYLHGSGYSGDTASQHVGVHQALLDRLVS